MANTADALLAYGEIIADEDYETTNGHFVRITTFQMNGEKLDRKSTRLNSSH